MAIVFKAIKPKKLNDREMRKVYLDAIRDFGDEMVKEFHKTTATWEHKPKFEKLFQLSQGQAGVFVGTDDEIYGYVNDGTKDHWVEPVNASALAFNALYSAKTSPGRIGSSPGGPMGPVVFSKGHEVSGIEPRNFDEDIQKQMQPRFKRKMEQAMREARNVSGHAI